MISEIPKQPKSRDLVFQLLTASAKPMTPAEIVKALVAAGRDISGPSVINLLKNDERVEKIARGLYSARSEKSAHDAAVDRTEKRWLESTEGLRDHGVMPPEVARVLFGRNDPYAPPTAPPPAPVSVAADPSPEPVTAGAIAPFRPSVAGVSAKLHSLAWLLGNINSQIASLKQLSGVDLEEVTVHAVDVERLKRLTQAGADGLSHFEAMLCTAAEFHR